MNKKKNFLPNRREFIRQSLMAGVGTSLLGVSAFEMRLAAPAFDFITFDLHAHPGVFYAKGREGYAGDEGIVKTVAAMNEVRLSGVFMSLVVDSLVNKRTPTGIVPARDFEKGEAWKEYKRQLMESKKTIGMYSLRLAREVGDLNKKEDTRTAAFLACEGGDFLESADQVNEVYGDGVRAIQLVHYAPNPLGDLQTFESQHNGLSALGKAVVKRMNEVHMVVDVAHASYLTVKDVVEASSQPIVLSHSILKVNEERPVSARAITEEHAKLVASTGGVIGAWPSGFNSSFEDYVDNIIRLIEVVGIDHVGIGTDMDSNYKPVLDNYKQLRQLMIALEDKGLSKDELEKVAGEMLFGSFRKC